jgi:hypothetical protein
MEPVAFTVTIPLRDTEIEDIKAAFLALRPYGAPVPASTILDNAGNSIPNPITLENYVEDCIGYYILAVTKSYLVEKAASEAKDQEAINVDNTVSDLASWMRG